MYVTCVKIKYTDCVFNNCLTLLFYQLLLQCYCTDNSVVWDPTRKKSKYNMFDT